MPQNITDVDAFTDPLTAPAGADAADSASILAMAQKIANRTKNIIERLGSAAGSGEFAYRNGAGAAVTKTRKLVLPAAEGTRAAGYGLGSNLEAIERGLERIPEGSVITQIRCKVNPGTAQAVAANRLVIRLYESDPIFGTAASVPTDTDVGNATDNGSTGVQIITISGLSVAVTKETKALTLYAQKRNAGALDTVYLWEITYTTTTLRGD